MNAPKLILANLNAFSGMFAKVRTQREDSLDKQKYENSASVSSEDNLLMTLDSAMTSTGAMNNQPWNSSSVTVTSVQFAQVFSNKKQKVSKYREMSNYPVIAEALDHNCDDAIVEDEDGKILQLDITKELPKSVEAKARYIWEKMINDVMEINDTAWGNYRRFMTDSELYAEKVLNRSGTKIVGVKVIPCYTMTPIYEGMRLKGYMQVPENMGNTKTKEISFDRDQIVHLAYDHGYNIMDVRGYLDSAIKLYNQLKSLEDSIVVAQLARAPDRRIWNVDCGNMPKPRAEEYMRGLIQRTKKKFTYDPESGAVNVAQNVIAMTEDYWFAKMAGGGGTSVEFINGTNNLGDMDGVMYILKQLYRVLKMPKARWEEGGNSMFPEGKMGEITQDEVHWARFVSRNQNKFKNFYKDPFMTQLKLSGFEDRYCNPRLYNVKFTTNNMFKEFKELDIVSSKMDILNSMTGLLWSTENEQGLFHPKFVMSKYLHISDEDLKENEQLIGSAKGETVEAAEPEDIGGSSMEPEQIEKELSAPPEEETGEIGPNLSKIEGGEEEAKAESLNIVDGEFSILNECRKELVKINKKHNVI